MKKSLIIAAALLAATMNAQAIGVAVGARAAPVSVARSAPVSVRTAPVVAPVRPVTVAPVTKPTYAPAQVQAANQSRATPFMFPATAVHATSTQKKCPEGTKLDEKTKECKKPQ